MAWSLECARVEEDVCTGEVGVGGCCRVAGDAGLVWDAAGVCVCDAVRKRLRRVSGSLVLARIASVFVSADGVEFCCNGVVAVIRFSDTTG